MWPDWVSNTGPLALESDMLPTVLCGTAATVCCMIYYHVAFGTKKYTMKEKKKCVEWE